jgi:hypothetical protein
MRTRAFVVIAAVVTVGGYGADRPSPGVAPGSPFVTAPSRPPAESAASFTTAPPTEVPLVIPTLPARGGVPSLRSGPGAQQREHLGQVEEGGRLDR